MNIIEAVHEIFGSFPSLGEIGVDLAEESPDSTALTSTGDSLIRYDIIGNQRRLHTFLLHTVWQSHSDFERMNNSGKLLELAHYIERHAPRTPVTAELDGAAYDGEILTAECSNGMLYAIPDTVNGGVVYQLQIAVTYQINTGGTT